MSANRIGTARRLALGWAIGGVLLPLAVLCAVAAEVAVGQPPGVDLALLWWVHGFARPGLDTFMKACSAVGSHLPVGAFAVFGAMVLGWSGRWRMALFLAGSVCGAQALNPLVKSAMQRPRPQLWVPLAHEASFSFPSGHAAQSMALAVALLVLAWPTRWRAAVALAGAAGVALVGVSRLYLGAHYPSDVLAGWCAALAWVMLLRLVTQPAVQARPGLA